MNGKVNSEWKPTIISLQPPFECFRFVWATPVSPRVVTAASNIFEIEFLRNSRNLFCYRFEKRVGNCRRESVGWCFTQRQSDKLPILWVGGGIYLFKSLPGESPGKRALSKNNSAKKFQATPPQSTRYKTRYAVNWRQLVGKVFRSPYWERFLWRVFCARWNCCCLLHPQLPPVTDERLRSTHKIVRKVSAFKADIKSHKIQQNPIKSFRRNQVMEFSFGISGDNLRHDNELLSHWRHSTSYEFIDLHVLRKLGHRTEWK